MYSALKPCQPLYCSVTADHFAQATTSLYKLRGLLQQQAPPSAWAQAMSAPDASWRVEEAKLLWAQGQQDTAVQLARTLLGARSVPCCAAFAGCWVSAERAGRAGGECCPHTHTHMLRCRHFAANMLHFVHAIFL